MSKIESLYFKIEIHPLFWAMGAIAVLTAQFQHFLLIFSIVFLHECGHVLAMKKYNWNVRRILLFPFGGIAETDEFHTKPLQEEFIVTIMGPLVHLIIEAVIALVIFAGLAEYRSVDHILYLNRIILGVNLLPIFPLDGGRILSLFFQKITPYYNSLRMTILTSIAVSFLAIFLLFFIKRISIGNIFVFFYIQIYLVLLWRKKIYVFMRFLINRLNHFIPWAYPIQTETCSKETSLYELCKHLFRSRTHLFQIEGDDSNHKEHDVLYAYLYNGTEIITMDDYIKTLNR